MSESRGTVGFLPAARAKAIGEITEKSGAPLL